MKDVENIPDGNGGSLNLVYHTPLRSSVASGTISSTFPHLLGNKTSPNSLIGAIYASLQRANESIAGLAQGVDNFALTQSNHQNITTKIINDARSTSDNLFHSLLLTTDIFKSAPLTAVMKYL